MKKLLREPLVHFLGLGLGLFLLFGLVGDSPGTGESRIVVPGERIAQLAEVFARTWQRPPTEGELAGLVEDHVREEIYYREALAMGLDDGDTVVRRRLRQKLEFVTEDLAATVAPTEEQLERYLREHPDRFSEPARLSLRQVYLSPERRRERLAADAEALLATLNAMSADADVAALGDPLMLESTYAGVTPAALARDFGRGFAEALDELPTGRWSGPVASGFGAHLVRIDERTAGSLPPLAAVRDVVEREWRAERRREADEALYRTLRARYDVVVEWPDAIDPSDDPSVAESRP